MISITKTTRASAGGCTDRSNYLDEIVYERLDRGPFRVMEDDEFAEYVRGIIGTKKN